MQSRGIGNDILYVAAVDGDQSLCRPFSRLFLSPLEMHTASHLHNLVNCE